MWTNPIKLLCPKMQTDFQFTFWMRAAEKKIVKKRSEQQKEIYSNPFYEKYKCIVTVYGNLVFVYFFFTNLLLFRWNEAEKKDYFILVQFLMETASINLHTMKRVSDFGSFVIVITRFELNARHLLD